MNRDTEKICQKEAFLYIPCWISGRASLCIFLIYLMTESKTTKGLTVMGGVQKSHEKLTRITAQAQEAKKAADGTGLQKIGDENILQLCRQTWWRQKGDQWKA